MLPLIPITLLHSYIFSFYTYSSFIPHPTFTYQSFFSPFIWLKCHRCNNGVTCARIYCHVFIYVRMRLRKPRVKWKGYHGQEKYPTLLLLFEVIGHIWPCTWRGGGSRGFDQNKVASEGGQIRVTRHGDKPAGKYMKRYTPCWRINNATEELCLVYNQIIGWCIFNRDTAN
jgi:hypothetical protein